VGKRNELAWSCSCVRMGLSLYIRTQSLNDELTFL
jgi:hypothetical protein